MSTIIEKRNYLEKFGEPLVVNTYSLDKYHFNKKLKLNHDQHHQQQQRNDHNKLNIDMLKELYPTINEQEIISVLFDCDDNIDIAKEILDKQVENLQQQQSTTMMMMTSLQQQHHMKHNREANENRKIRSIKTIKDNQRNTIVEPNSGKSMITEEIKSNNTNNMIESFIRQQEEQNMNNMTTNDEINNFTDTLVAKLVYVNSLDQAKAILGETLQEFHNGIKKKVEQSVKKLQEEKSILIKAFSKQREKSNLLTQKNEELQSQLDLAEQNINKLNLINYKLGLRLKSLDMSDEEKINFQVYQNQSTYILDEQGGKRMRSWRKKFFFQQSNVYCIQIVFGFFLIFSLFMIIVE